MRRQQGHEAAAARDLEGGELRAARLSTWPWKDFRRRKAPTIAPWPARPAPPASARNSRCRENQAVIIEPSRPKAICAAMKTMCPAMTPRKDGPRSSREESALRAIMATMWER